MNTQLRYAFGLSKQTKELSMKGYRPFTRTEIDSVRGAFSGRDQDQDRAPFVLGYRTGFRVWFKMRVTSPVGS